MEEGRGAQGRWYAILSTTSCAHAEKRVGCSQKAFPMTHRWTAGPIESEWYIYGLLLPTSNPKAHHATARAERNPGTTACRCNATHSPEGEAASPAGYLR